jgi:hypothetical protein
MSASVKDVKLPVVSKYGGTTRTFDRSMGKVGKAILSVYRRIVKMPGNLNRDNLARIRDITIPPTPLDSRWAVLNSRKGLFKEKTK